MSTAINRGIPICRLQRAEWERCRDAHLAGLSPIIEAHRARRSAGRKHPVIDFLFEYYPFRPSSLEQWSPGVGIVLEDGAAEFGDRKHFETAGGEAWVSPAGMSPRLRQSTGWILTLLEQTQHRPPMFGCHGLHEWAMVYRGERRHDQVPLRLDAAHIEDIVEAGPLVCTHFDAFRFFTPEARPLNRQTLSPGEMTDQEQPGCLHANMDVYRWATKRYPWVGSDLIREAFLVALEIRAVDMRASPYDLSALGYEPIPIETEEGRAEYRRLQMGFHQRVKPIRDRLIEAYRVLLPQEDDLQVG